MYFLIITINTKFINSLQPEWLKYVTQVRLAKRLTVDTFDDLFDYLQQFEKLVNISRAKKLEKSHDSSALVAHTGSSSRNTSSYFVTHPTFVVDYDDEYQQDDIQTNSKDPLTFPMNSGNVGRNNRHAYVQEEVIEGYNETDASRMEEIEDLSANICLMARIQPTNHSFDVGPSYDSTFISEVQSSSINENKEQIQMSEKEDSYHDTIKDLKEKLKKNVDLILKLGNSLQGMLMLGPKPLSVYDQQLKHSLGYSNPYTLRQAISQYPNLYSDSSLGNSEIPLNVRDSEDTLDDASKSQQKVKEKMNDPIAVANKQKLDS
uniref:Gag-Pol polyprotein n=1 Tax=Tanacetum cinerariifolium TaxID=118510 RepID=A0A699GPW8_TANCI|nr:hypothetical protein [Tanacetum cinerariifolium]